MQGRTSLQCSENWLRFLDFFQNGWGLLIDKRNKTHANQQVNCNTSTSWSLLVVASSSSCHSPSTEGPRIFTKSMSVSVESSSFNKVSTPNLRISCNWNTFELKKNPFLYAFHGPRHLSGFMREVLLCPSQDFKNSIIKFITYVIMTILHA